ncbi:hypothetical protein [Arthrobacter sp. UYCo732]|uniref:hypothetical protein n=1 Tax=Arthrobacter sp. UYCo732 TaxID=3156336 RepID=UPI003396BBF5
MTADSKQLHPALQFLKDNAVVIGLVVVVAASVAFFAFTQNAPAAKSPVGAVTPAPVATAQLETGTATSPSAGPSDQAGSPAPSDGTAGSQGGGQPSPTPSASEPVVLGKEPQGVKAKEWRPYAKDFASAWVNTADGKEAWLSRLKPLVSDRLYAGYVTTDIRVIPAVTVDSVSMAEESLGFKTFVAYSTAGPLLQGRVAVQADGSWLVDQVSPPKK